VAFVQKNLSRVSGTQFWQYWNYDDTIRTIKARDYFFQAKSLLAVGDWIFITATNGSAILHVDEIDPLELGTPQ
jgi:hypothetical protein